MSSEAKIECRVRLSNADFIMQNHRVHGVSILPGVTFLDIVYRILAAQRLDHRRAILRNILFPEAVVTRSGFDRDMRITMVEADDGNWQLKSESRWIEGELPRSGWNENFRSDLSFEDELAAGRIDIAALKSGARQQRDMEELYRWAHAEGIRHGAAMKCHGTIYIGDSYLLAELRLDPSSLADHNHFYLHPAELDASTIAAFARTQPTEHVPYIPVFVERFRAHRALPEMFYLYSPQADVRVPSGDLLHSDYFLYDGEGGCVAECTRLTCKRIRLPELITRAVEEVGATRTDGGVTGTTLAGSAAASPSPDGAVPLFRDRVREMVAHHLGQRAAAIKTSVPFYDLGLDSLAMLRISQELETVVQHSLYPTLLFEYGNIDALAAHLASKYTFHQASAEAQSPAGGLQISDGVRLQATCYRREWCRAEAPRNAGTTKLGDVVIFGADDDLQRALYRRLADPARRVIRVLAGTRFGEVEPGIYELDFTSREQLRFFLQAIDSAGVLPGQYVYIAGLSSGDVPRASDAVRTCLSLWALATELAVRSHERGCNLRLVYREQDGQSTAQYAAAGALARTLSDEAEVLRARVMALDGNRSATSAADIICQDLLDETAESEVRFHNGERQLKRYAPYTLPSLVNSVVLKSRGVYVLAGAGGICRLVADRLAEDWKARLVFIGRRPLQEGLKAKFPRWRACGAEVTYVQADITHEADVTAALAGAREQFGRIDGIFHCAGRVADALFFRKDASDIVRVVAPKIMGAIHLDAATRHDELDVFVMFSSLSASITNLGQCDYAFANAFLEHFAEWRASRSDRSGKTLAIGWPLWAEGGMQVAPEVKERSRQQTGIVPLPTDVALDILFRGMSGPASCFAVTYGAPEMTGRMFPHAPLTTFEPEKTAVTSAASGDSGNTTPAEESAHVAIIGLAGQYPQARNVDEFWQNLLAGRDCIVEVPADRWDHSLFFDQVKGRTGKTYSKWGGFLDGVDLFDPGLFGISRKEAEGMDPQERLFLKTSWLALHDAGYMPQALSGETVGVFTGVMWNHYQLFEDPESATAPTAMHAAVANRVSYCFNFRGPSVAVDTACSSSLTALHLAVESIRRGECSVALAGGVNVTIHPQKYLQLAQGQFLSSDGRCRSFGKDGSGYVPGEGVGAVLLKPLAKALADGDQIYAVIKGSFLNHTGRSSGFTVPSPDSQADVIREAMARAAVAPETIGYIEAHGTGTSLGDPIELNGLEKAFAASSLPRQSCAIGSVKSNIGHLESAAGIAGLTKVVLQMKHRTLVPSLHAEEVNPHINLRNSPFFIPRQPLPWRPGPGARLRAGVSAFGAGGANVHVVLEAPVPAASPQSSDGPFLVLLSARDEPALKSYVQSMVSFLDGRTISSGLPAGSVHQEFLRDVVAEMIGVPRDAVNPQESFRDLGFDPVRLAELAERIAADSPNGGSSAALTLDTTVESVASCALTPSGDGALSLDDLAFTLQVGRTPMAARLAIVTHDFSGLRSGLCRFSSGADPGDDEFWNLQPATAASDADAKTLVELFHAGKLHDVARRWVAGANVPWRRCYPRPGWSRLPGRISLPCPPFSEERCWVGRWKSQHQSNGAMHTKNDAEVPGPGVRSRAQTARGAAAKALHSGSEPVMRIVDGGVAAIAMRDPNNANMFTERVLDDVKTAFADVARRPEIKAVVITGTGNVFSMGADRESLEKLVAREARFTDSPFLYEGLLRCDRPVVAAIQGHASGGGLIFGLYADVVLMAREGVYSANFLKYGFTPGLGATYLLEKRFGPSLAAEMFYTGRSFTGEELERRGAQVLFLPQDQVLEKALDLARSIAEQPSNAVQALKRELGGRILKKLPDVVASEDAMHDRVLGDGAVQRIRDHFRKVEQFQSPAAAVQIREEEKPCPEPKQPHKPAQHEQASSADYDAIVAVIESALCAHLYVERREIDRQLTFHEMGVDSIGAVEMVRDLNRCFDLSLDSATVYDYPTVPRLAEFVLGRCAEERTEAAPTAVAATADRGAVQFVEEASAPTNPASAKPADLDLVALQPLTSSSILPSSAAPASREYKVVLAPAEAVAFAASETLNPTPAASATEHVVVLAPTHPARDVSSSSPAKASGAGVDTSVLMRSTLVGQSSRSVSAVNSPAKPPAKIAVIGMSGRFPDASDLNAFWANLCAGRCSVREVPPDRWDNSRITDPETHCRWGAFLDQVDRFDAAFFHLSPMEAELMDPQQRVFLEHAWGALEDAGYAGAAGSTQRCGVFVGSGAGDYLRLLEDAGAADAGHVFLGNTPSILAARIAYFLNLNGPTIALDTACSSSLVAVHMACESIRNGECDLALAGGVALMFTPTMHVWTSKLAILSPTGRCAPFDKSANGIVLGEGVGVVALKALEKALEDGDHIYGVIAASGMNGDGKTNGITSPSALSQIALLDSVYARAGLTGEDITYVETHGTGTPLGDPIEVKALNHVFRRHASQTGYCGIGSVKSNIGHTTLAAGIAGLIKVLLSLKHSYLPPSVNFQSANPNIDFGTSPCFVVTQGTDWRPGKSGRRIGAVSSFGFSGTNCHVVVEEAPPYPLRHGEPDGNRYFIVPVSAKTEDALRNRLRQLSDYLTNRPRLADLSYTLAVARQHFRFRTAFVVKSLQELSQALGLVLAGERAPQAFHYTPGVQAPDLPVSGSDYLERLARCYVQGSDPDWTHIYKGCAARRISLPTYPFARDRHWIKRAALPAIGTVQRHVLLGRRLPEIPVGHGVVFANEILPDNLIVADHLVNGRPILPGVACLVMALSAAADEVSVPVRLTSVRWLQPLEVGRPRRIRFSVVPDGGRWVFELHVEDEQVPYARGTVSPTAERSSSEIVDLRAWAEHCPASVSRQQIYAAFDRAGIHYGPAFQALESVSFGEDRALGKLSAPRVSVGDPSRLELDPCLLDAALQAAAMLESQSGDGPRIPVSLDSLELLRPLTVPAFTCVTRTGDHAFDVVIADPEGHVCVSCKGFALRTTRVEREAAIRIPEWRDAEAVLASAPPSTRTRRVGIYYAAGASLPLVEELGRLHAHDDVVEAQLGRESLQSPLDVLYLLPSVDGPAAAPEESTLALFRLVKKLISIDQPHHPLELKIVLTGEYRRLALPTPFFAKDSYWVESAEPVAQVAAALAASSEDSIRTSEVTLTGTEPFLRDHVVGGRRLLPAVVFLEMFRSAAAEVLAAGATRLRLKNVVWSAPICVDGEPVPVQIRLRQQRNGDVGILCEALTQASGVAAHAISHCRAVALPGEAGSFASPTVDLGALRAACSRSAVGKEAFYAQYRGFGVEYGSTHRAVENVYVGDDQVVAELSLPADAPSVIGGPLLHPGLVDAALQAAICLMTASGDLVPVLPFALKELTLSAPPASRMWAWIRHAGGDEASSAKPDEALRRFDVDLCDEAGHVCIALRGFVVRRLPVPSQPPVNASEPAVSVPAGLTTTAAVAAVPPPSASEPETVRLLPVWEAVTPERTAATPSPADHVVVVGADERLVSRLTSRHRNLLAVTIGAGDDVDAIARAVRAIERIDHVIWIAPDARLQRPIDGRMIVEQQAGVLQLFRLIKALLGRRLGRTPVGWTVITFRCQAIHAADPIDPTHAGVHGLVGSMAKEYEHWKVRLLDLASQDALDEIDVATLPFDARGNALACRDGHWYRQTLIPMEDQPHAGESASLCRRGATYVVIGGAGGLGRVWTEYVARRYHAQVVWIGRRPLDDAIAGGIAAVGESGPAPIYIAADATRRADLERARAEITQRFGDIHGIVHSAIVLLDQTLANLTEERFVASLAAKIDTSVLLADVFRSEPLDFFLFFSSMNSFSRGPGQSSYAAGCVFKDALARHLAQSRSAAIRVINWGYWGEVGVVASSEYRWRMARFGVASIEPADAMQPLETLLTGPVDQLGLLKATKKLPGIEYSERATVQAQRAGSRAAMSAVERTLARLSDCAEAVGETAADTAALATLNALLTDLLFAQLRCMGLDSEPRTALEIEQQCDIAARYRRWLDESLAILARRQYLSVADDRFSIAKSEALAIEVLWQRWHAQKAAWASAAFETALMRLAEPAIEALPDVLRGSQPPTRILFPRGSMDLVEGIYKHNPVADHFNNVVADCVAAHVSAVLEESPAAGIRILEVGAGTGAATAAVLAKLTPYRKDIVEYCYTDLSPAFLLHAQAQYGPANPFLSYAILNLSQPLAIQNVACGAYDIVIASNVLHATRNVRQAVRNAKAALTRGGVLVLSELSRTTLFTHVTFGLLDGWWQNDDADLRMRGGPLLAPRTWRHVLESEGFVNVSFSADTPYEFGQQVIVAASDGVVRQPTREPSPSRIAEPVCEGH